MHPQNITVRLKFSVYDILYANCGAIAVTASTTYMTIMGLSTSFNIDVGVVINDVISGEKGRRKGDSSMETERNIKLAVEGNRFWSRSIITTLS